MALESRKNLMKKIFGVSGAVLISRIFGLFRVRLEAEVLGGGAVASAWAMAFAFPNMFRRLLGEGSLGNALMPIIADVEEKYGRDSVKGTLAVIFPCLGLILAVMVILASLAAFTAGFFFPPEENYRVYLVCRLTPLLMPYAIFICMTGIITAVLNYARSFVLPAFYSLSMNIFLVGGLTWGYCSGAGKSFASLEDFLEVLSVLFLISGVLQLVLMAVQLKIVNYFPDFSSWRRHTGVLKKLWDLALPGLLGSGAIQISFLVDRHLALFVNDQGVAALTYVDRLIDLPIGLFGVAMGQVFMARMTSAAAAGDLESLQDDMNYGLRQVLFLSIPMAAGVCFFHELMLKIICLGGNYTMSDLDAARMAALFYGSGVPFFCAIKIIQPAFYARKDMKTPLYCTLTTVTLNIVLSIALIRPLAHSGIALATVITTFINCSLLIFFLKKAGITFGLKNVSMTLIRSLLAAGAAGGICKVLLELFYNGSGRFADVCALGCAGVLFLLIYLAITLLTRGREISETLGRFRKKNA